MNAPVSGARRRHTLAAHDSAIENKAPARGVAKAAIAQLPPRPVSNWNTKISSTPKAIFTPTSENQIVGIMKKEQSVRVIGALHSFNEAIAVDPTTAVVNMIDFNRVWEPVRHADGSYTVSVQPGATLADVSRVLHRHGLAIENLPTIETITVGGALANGAHGSGLTTAAGFAEQVVGMRVVTSAGEKKTMTDEELPLYRINLGLLGVVTKVTLRCVPDFELVTADDKINGEAAIADALESTRLRAELQHYQSCIYIYKPDIADPNKSELVRQRLARVTDENRAAIEAAGYTRKTGYDAPTKLDEFAINKAYAAAAAAKGREAHDIKAKMLARWQPRSTPVLGRSALMYQVWLDHPNYQVSYAVPIEKAQEAYKRVMAKLRELGYEATAPLAMRFLRGTQATLLGINSGGRDVATFDLTSSVLFDDPKTGKLRADEKQAEDAFEQIMIDLGGRPHWGKNFTKSPKDCYPPEVWERFACESEHVGTKLVNDWAESFTPARRSRARAAAKT